MKKKLEVAELQNQLAGSVFFRKPKPNPPSMAEKPAVAENKQSVRGESPSSPAPKVQQLGNPNVTTSARHDVPLKRWREIIENTETQNSALRLTAIERYAVEDLLQNLRRKHK